MILRKVTRTKAVRLPPTNSDYCSSLLLQVLSMDYVSLSLAHILLPKSFKLFCICVKLTVFLISVQHTYGLCTGVCEAQMIFASLLLLYV